MLFEPELTGETSRRRDRNPCRAAPSWENLFRGVYSSFYPRRLRAPCIFAGRSGSGGGTTFEVPYTVALSTGSCGKAVCRRVFRAPCWWAEIVGQKNRTAFREALHALLRRNSCQ